jgi:hypothetical protein
MVDGLHAHLNTVRQNQANKLVTTDGNGYIQAGWINTTSGAISSTIDKIYASNDGYIRYITPTNLGSQLSQYINYDNLLNKPTIPSNTNQLTNGAGFLTSSNDRAYLTDSRGASRAPSYYDDRYVQWDFQSSTDTGAGGDAWHALQTVSKWSSFHSSHRQEQIAFTGNNLRHRVASSDSAWNSWDLIWDSGNDGSGSGLDADLLDGQHGSYYLNAANFTGTAPTGSPFLSNFVHLGTATTSGYATDDGSWGSRLNVSSTIHAKIEVSQEANSMRSHWYAHTGQDSIKFGTSTSHDVELQRAGSTSLEIESGGVKFYVPIRRSDHHATGFLEGSYNNVGANGSKTNPIYTIGSNYNPTETGLSNMYGIGFARRDQTGYLGSFTGSGWGMYVAADGDARVWLDAGNGQVQSTGQHYAAGSLVWNAGNDGSGSGLDADLLDGQHGSY